MKKQFTKEEVENAFNSVGRIEKAARILGVRYVTMKNLLMEYQIPFKIENKKMQNISIEELQKAYEENNADITKLAAKFNITTTSLYKHLYKHNLHIPNHHNCDHDFFAKDTEESWYWAGFIAADGNITKNTLRINISIDDKEHLEKFKLHINGTQEVKILPARISKFEDKEVLCRESVTISITSQKIVKDLKERFNIVPAKSLIYTIPENILSHHLIKHFIRGLLDGDGSWFITMDRMNLSVCGTKDVCEKIHKVFLMNNFVSNDCFPQKGKGNYYKLVFSSQFNLIKIREFLYKDASIFLKRKYDVALQIEDHIKRQPINLNKEEIEHLYKETNSVTQVAKKLDLSNSFVFSFMNKNNIEYDHRERTKVNENFFNEDHWYWFGYFLNKIYAYKSKSTCTLSIRDKMETLNEINKIINSEYEIKMTNALPEIEIHSIVLEHDFQELKKNIFSILAAKSQEQQHEFIIGYIDANIAFYKKIHIRNQNKLCAILGKKDFLDQFQILLKDEFDINTSITEANPENQDQNCRKLVFEYDQICLLMNKLYSEQQYYQESVKEKFEAWKDKFANMKTKIQTHFDPNESWRFQKPRKNWTIESLLEIAKTCKTKRDMAKKMECTEGNLFAWMKKLNAKSQIDQLLLTNSAQP